MCRPLQAFCKEACNTGIHGGWPRHSGLGQYRAGAATALRFRSEAPSPDWPSLCWQPIRVRWSRPIGSVRSCGVTANPPTRLRFCKATSPACGDSSDPKPRSSPDRRATYWRPLPTSSTPGASSCSASERPPPRIRGRSLTCWSARKPVGAVRRSTSSPSRNGPFRLRFGSMSCVPRERGPL